jgi:uncharacterized protein
VLRCLFASDLHGHLDRYDKLFAALRKNPPAALFLGGDLFPHGLQITPREPDDFFQDIMVTGFAGLKSELGAQYPRIFIVLGNDDSRACEPELVRLEADGLWEYSHNQVRDFGGYSIYGYAYIPPSPFLFKDWEKYDVSRFIDPGCVSPEEGYRSVPAVGNEAKYSTIEQDLQQLAGTNAQERSIWLFHTPPHKTNLDRAALDGKTVEHVPLDVHIGSIAVQRFIQTRQPRLTLHGHVHESARLTGSWQDRIGKTVCMSAAHDGPELALVEFDLEEPDQAVRHLL